MPIEQSNIVPGEIVEGKVQGITQFGAFIELPGGVVGLVHISEIADTYVKDVKEFLKEGDDVKVKILNVAGKKIGLSIKQAVAKPPEPRQPSRPMQNAQPRPSNNNPRPNQYNNNSRPSQYNNSPRPNQHNRANQKPANASLDDKIAKFLKESDERMQPLKSKNEPKRRRSSGFKNNESHD